MYRVVMVAGRVKREMYSFETEEVAPDGGFVWDFLPCSLSQMGRRKRGII